MAALETATVKAHAAAAIAMPQLWCAQHTKAKAASADTLQIMCKELLH